MTTESNPQKIISKYNWPALLRLWRQIISGSTSGWEPGQAFEHLILRAFQLEKAEVQWPYQVQVGSEIIEQIDGVVYSNGLACLIECKDQADPVNIEPIAKLRNQLLRRPGATIGVVFSRSGFTIPAITLAQFLAPQTILLWNGDEIEFALRQRGFRRGLTAKYRFCVEKGFPNHDLLGEEFL